MAFDSVAASYDQTFGLSPSGRLFRFRLAERIAAATPLPTRILDIGCGTGEDALWLAEQGHTVVGVDESEAMISVARAKAARRRSTATFQSGSIEALVSSGATFDRVISNFGALNCIPLDTWTALVPRLLSRSGRGFVVLMGRRPLPEMLHGRRNPDRGAGSAEVRIGATSVTVNYESVAAVEAALSRTTTVERIEALGCLVPAPIYADFARRRPVTMALLAMGESLLRATALFRDRGDHTLYEFRLR